MSAPDAPPPVPLIETRAPGAADAWHAVRAPGGYEWWYFDAEDNSTGVRVVAIFFDGFPFHPAYLRGYDRFRRAPTRNRPPLPEEYRCVYLAVYEGQRVLCQTMDHFPAADFCASRESGDVRIGANRIMNEEGEYKVSVDAKSWRLTWRGPRREPPERVAAELRFRNRAPAAPCDRPFFPGAAGERHRWVVAAPFCAVSGSVRIERTGAPKREIVFQGAGYHDHNYGTEPLGQAIDVWMWGRILLEDRALIFHWPEPFAARATESLELLEADGGGLREMAGHGASVEHVSGNHGQEDHSPPKRTGWGIKYPQHVSLGKSGLVLQNPKVIDSTPFYLRLTYDVPVLGAGVTAFCEVASPGRLRWPLLGRMVEMSVSRST